MKLKPEKDQVIVICIIVLGFLLAAAMAHAQSVPDVECPEGYICTWSGSDGSVNTTGEMTTTVISPPPTAVSPQFSAGNGNDLGFVRRQPREYRGRGIEGFERIARLPQRIEALRDRDE